MEETRRAGLAGGWVPIAILTMLCATLAMLQYRWTGEVSRAERMRMQESLGASLNRVRADFNNEVSVVCRRLMATSDEINGSNREAAYLTRYIRWQQTGRQTGMFRRIALAIPEDSELRLAVLKDGAFVTSAWPDEWSEMKASLSRRAAGGPFRMMPIEDDRVIELPRFTFRSFENRGRETRGRGEGRGPGEPPGPRDRPREAEWLLLEVNADYVREHLLGPLLARHLPGNDYAIRVVSRADRTRVIVDGDTGENPDATTTLFDIRFGPMGPPRSRGAGTEQAGPAVRAVGPERPEMGFGFFGRDRWVMTARHKAGSLEAVVNQIRWRNLGVSAAILLTLIATVALLLRYSRESQRLAELQMQFVAGVSHELRTPLTVIRTAGYNLRGRVAANPAHVERYGTLIQEEADKLTAIVEQVLRFANSKAGRVLHEKQPVGVSDLLGEVASYGQSLLKGSPCRIETDIPHDLPPVMADRLALRHALQNLVDNAVKYGSEGGDTIRIKAEAERDRKWLQLSVADRGPGIPVEEQKHIFDAFFRGKQAVRDQVHGTGLGLNLVKRIVEAHGGTVAVYSEPMKGAEFLVRLPVAEHQDEFANTTGRG